MPTKTAPTTTRTGRKREPEQHAPGSPKVADRAPSSRVKEISPEVAAVWAKLEPAITKALNAFGPLSADNAHLYREFAVLQGRPWNKHYQARKEFGA